MILQCDACGARFKVPPGSIGPEGKQVRCGRCQHSWFFVPAEEAEQGAAANIPHPTEEEAVEDALAEEALEEAIEEKKEEDAEDVVEMLSPRRHAAMRPAVTRRRTGPPVLITIWSAAMVLLACGLGVLNFSPQLVGLRSTQGLVLQGLTLKKPEPDKNHFTLTGAIVNKNKIMMNAPQMRIRLLNDDGSISREWHRTLPQGAALEGGGRLSFTIDDLDAPAKLDIKDPHIRVEIGNRMELAIRRP